ncbi:hypothetical protein OC835_005928 [Tilletia horrida]|nr:hypothetical protein OC835_005928 [Tilletia horrida]
MDVGLLSSFAAKAAMGMLLHGRYFPCKYSSKMFYLNTNARRALTLVFVALIALSAVTFASPVDVEDRSIPLNGTGYPTDPCTAAKQCKSGRCLANLDARDEEGLAGRRSHGPSPKRCDYYENGQSGCRSSADCLSGLCRSGTCQAGADGDRCIINEQCQGLCGNDGLCFSAGPRSQSAQEPCKLDSQCTTASCHGSILFNRPSILHPGQMTTVLDTACDFSRAGGPCGSQGDCFEGACRSSRNGTPSKTCQLISQGKACKLDTQCASGACDAKSKTCGLKSASIVCGKDFECYSKSCDSGYCAPQPILGLCRTQRDCDDGSEYSSCSKGVCLSNNGWPCDTSKQCVSGHCVAFPTYGDNSKNFCAAAGAA